MLEDVRKVLDTPKKWNGQGGYARNAEGEERWWNDPDAVSWCLFGACKLVGNKDGEGAALDAAAQERGFDCTATFNDAPGRTYDEIMELIDEAAAYEHA